MKRDASISMRSINVNCPRCIYVYIVIDVYSVHMYIYIYGWPASSRRIQWKKNRRTMNIYEQLKSDQWWNICPSIWTSRWNFHRRKYMLTKKMVPTLTHICRIHSHPHKQIVPQNSASLSVSPHLPSLFTSLLGDGYFPGPSSNRGSGSRPAHHLEMSISNLNSNTIFSWK